MSKTTKTTTATNKPARAPRKGKTVAAAPVQGPETTGASEVMRDEAPAGDALPEGIIGFEVHPDETPAPVAPAAAPAPVLTYAQQLAAALRARPQASKDLDIAVSGLSKGAAAVNLLQARPEWADVCDALLRDALIADKTSPRFIAVKVWVKIVHAMQGFAAGMQGYFDPYSKTICTNLANLATVHGQGITNKSALVSLSKAVSYTETEQVQTLTRHYNCSVGTASTQASSTRMMLRALGVCEVTKGKNGDVVRTIEGNARCDAMLALFAPKPAT